MLNSSQECLLPPGVQALGSRISANGRVMYEQMRTGKMTFTPGTPNSPTPQESPSSEARGGESPLQICVSTVVHSEFVWMAGQAHVRKLLVI